MIKLELSSDEINSILQIFGELPTKSGVWPLAIKIKQQAEEQLKSTFVEKSVKEA